MHENINQNEKHHNEVNLTDYIRVVLQYKWLIFLIFTVIMSATVYYTVKAEKIYQSSARILLEESKNAQDFMMFASDVTSKTINNTTQILRSKPVILTALELLKRDPNFENMPLAKAESPAGALLKMLSIETMRESDVLILSCESTSPYESAAAVNAIAGALKRENQDYARQELTNIRRFLDEQLTNITTRLENSEEDLRSFKLREGISQLSAETEELIKQSADLEASLKSAITEYEIGKRRLAKLKNQLGQQDSLLVNVNAILVSPLLEELRREVVEKEARMANFLAKAQYSANHPEIISLNKELQNAKTKLNDAIRRITSVKMGSTDPLKYRGELISKIAINEVEVNVAEQKVKSLQKGVEEYNLKLTILPDTEIELARYERAFRINAKIHSLLVEKFEDAKIAEQAKMGNIRIIDEAVAPEKPIKPKKKLNIVIGFVFGLAFGVGTALLLHTLDTRIKTMEDIEKIVKLPVLGTIPHIKLANAEVNDMEREIAEGDPEKRQELKKIYAQISGRLISAYSPKSPVAESYRTLRTNILSAQKNTNTPEIILISSSGPKEGKSTTTANLAITLAQMRSKTVLIDVDLRRPMIHNIFQLERDNGMSEYLMSDIDYPISRMAKKTSVDNLDVITSGIVPPNPSELISSKRMAGLLEKLKEHYDYIIIDSPPIIAVTDALILAKKVDQVLLVIRNKITESEAIKRTKIMVQNVGITINGIVVNGIQNRKFYKGGYSYYNYYYYYYSDKDAAKEKNARVTKI